MQNIKPYFVHLIMWWYMTLAFPSSSPHCIPKKKPHVPSLMWQTHFCRRDRQSCLVFKTSVNTLRRLKISGRNRYHHRLGQWNAWRNVCICGNMTTQQKNENRNSPHNQQGTLLHYHTHRWSIIEWNFEWYAHCSMYIVWTGAEFNWTMNV